MKDAKDAIFGDFQPFSIRKDLGTIIQLQEPSIYGWPSGSM